jgi:DNA replication protein DnaC
MIVPCRKCGVHIEIIPIAGIETGDCEKCSQAASTHIDQARTFGDRRAEWARRTDHFKRYRQSDWYKLPCPEKTSMALQWAYGATGLNLWGKTGMGKTRTLLMVLERLFIEEKRSFMIFGPSDFGIELGRQGFGKPAWLSKLRAKDVLAFDDVGKARMSPVQEGDWFGIIEYFISMEKPILLTHNFDGYGLEGKFNNGEAIVSRIRQHFRSIHFA